MAPENASDALFLNHSVPVVSILAASRVRPGAQPKLKPQTFQQVVHFFLIVDNIAAPFLADDGAVEQCVIFAIANRLADEQDMHQLVFPNIGVKS